MDHVLNECVRDYGYYWVKRNGEWLPAKWDRYTSEEIEERFYEEHQELNSDDAVWAWGWMLDFDSGSDGCRVFEDKAFEEIGEWIHLPTALMAQR